MNLKPMEKSDEPYTYQLSPDAYRRIDKELTKYPPNWKQSAVMAALAIAQDEIGWVPPSVVEEIANYLGMPSVAAYEVLTFYNLYNVAPQGRFKLAVCTGLPCALRSATKAADYLKSKLGIEYDQTTSDGCFTLKESECLGACGLAPVLLVNNKRMCAFMDSERLEQLLSELRLTDDAPNVV